MEDIFIQALAERSKKEAGLIDQLPEDVKVLVVEKLSETNEPISDESLQNT
ncbi:MAG: hypothetical protein RBT57_02880 [Paludibacter sp.]|jgi:hypothetical protein|nr:hypothetical protein [Paludibacter sp.]